MISPFLTPTYPSFSLSPSLCFSRLYATKCQGCLQAVSPSELVMRASGAVYHLACFACVACGQRLQKGEEFVIRDGQLFCRLDFEKEFSFLPLSPKSEWTHLVNCIVELQLREGVGSHSDMYRRIPRKLSLPRGRDDEIDIEINREKIGGNR